MDKEDVVHIYTMEYYSAIKKNEIMPLAAAWMDLEIIILSEVSQTEKDNSPLAKDFSDYYVSHVQKLNSHPEL